MFVWKDSGEVFLKKVNLIYLEKGGFVCIVKKENCIRVFVMWFKVYCIRVFEGGELVKRLKQHTRY